MTPPADQSDLTAVRRILEERARALATPVAAQQRGVELAVLVLDGERYGVDIHSMREVLPEAHIAPLPGLPAPWLGLVNCRGHLYPVLDLSQYLTQRTHTVAERMGAKLMVVEAAGLEVALLVDDVPETVEMLPEEMGPPLADPRALSPGTGPRLLVVLDLDALLSDPTLVVDQE
jgi:purine-binding chemotaxis protein CheW